MSPFNELSGRALAELARNTCTHRQPLWVERRHSLRLSVQPAAARTRPCPVGRRARRPGVNGTIGRLEPSPGTPRVHISSRKPFRLPPWLDWLIASEHQSFALPVVDKQAPLPSPRPFVLENICSFVPVCRVSLGRWEGTALSFYSGGGKKNNENVCHYRRFKLIFLYSFLVQTAYSIAYTEYPCALLSSR